MHSVLLSVKMLEVTFSYGGWITSNYNSGKNLYKLINNSNKTGVQRKGKPIKGVPYNQELRRTA